MLYIPELFNVSLDYFAFDKREDIRRVQIGDRELMQKLEEHDRFSEQDTATTKAVLDTSILKDRFQNLALSADNHAAHG